MFPSNYIELCSPELQRAIKVYNTYDCVNLVWCDFQHAGRSLSCMLAVKGSRTSLSCTCRHMNIHLMESRAIPYEVRYIFS